MRLLKAGDFSKSIVVLSNHLCWSTNWEEFAVMHADTVKELLQEVLETSKLCKYLKLKMSHERLSKHLARELKGVYGVPTWGRVSVQLRTFMQTLEVEISDRRFVDIEEKKLDFLKDIQIEDGLPVVGPRSKAWFQIWQQFPSAKYESKEAVLCYVLDRYTACVFHSMRMAEIGLRALARRMKLKLPKRKKLEWAEWQQILKEMSGHTDMLGSSLKAGPAKDDILGFYSGAIGQFHGFKDEFRNQVMHVRRSYDESDAETALTQVRSFMQKLAWQIDERGRKVKQAGAKA